MKGDEIKAKQRWWVRPLIIFIRLSAWIIFPLILALSLGKYLDGKFHTSPYILFMTISVSFLFSMFYLFREARREIKALSSDKNENEKKSE